jgi:dihydroneopterin aldolase
MTTIKLSGAEFFAYHGFYPQEQKLGSKFIVDAEVTYTPVSGLMNDELSGTVNYEQLYHIIDEQMKQTKKLIETVAGTIATEVKSRFEFIAEVKVTVKKINPPLKGKVAYSSVTITL